MQIVFSRYGFNKIQKNVLIGWNVSFNTTDNHLLLYKEKLKNSVPISNSCHAWINSYFKSTKI